MRKPIVMSSLLLGLGVLPIVGCGDDSDDQGGGVGDDGKGGASAGK